MLDDFSDGTPQRSLRRCGAAAGIDAWGETMQRNMEAGDRIAARECMPGPGTIRVAICICTFKRQKMLRELLGGIAQLTFRKVRTPQIQIVVVDNDQLGTAREACETASLPKLVKYVVEPRCGITHARNRAITEAGPVDFIAFIDDDEVPSAQWLDELLWTQEEFGADVVSGPVSPRFAQEVADWVKTGRFFDARLSATGTPRKTCACNNVLVAIDVFRRVPKFDEAFALSGAEDTDFFLRAHQAGCRIVWSQEAVVFEAVSPKRGTIAWLLRREYQTGNGWVFCEARANGSLRNWIVRFARACGHIILGSLNSILRFVMLDKVAAVRSLQRVSLGMGMLTALAGHRFLAYQNPDAKPVKLESLAARLE